MTNSLVDRAKAILQRPISGPIGLDYDGISLRFVQIDRRASALTLRSAARLNVGPDLNEFLDSGPKAKRQIRDMLQRSGFRGNRIVTHAPSEDLRLMVLSYQLDAGASEPGVIVELARERMRSDLADYVIDYVPTRTSGDQQGERSALVALIPEETIVRHLERLERIGLAPEAIEIAPVAIRRLVVDLAERATHRTVLVLRFRPNCTQLTMLSGRRLLLYREVETGLDDIYDKVAKVLDCEGDVAAQLMSSYGVGALQELGLESSELSFEDPEGENPDLDGITGTLRETIRPALRPVIEQTHKAISYASFQTRGMSLDQIYLLEDAASCPGLDGLLSEMLQLPVKPLYPSEIVDSTASSHWRDGGQEFSVALGMAMREVGDA